MGKLRTLQPKLKPLTQRVQRLDAGADADRPGRPMWRDWYKTSRWQRLRWSVLERDLFTCQWPGCGRVMANTSQLVADHIIPHRGDERMFWDADNLQCLCKPCHDVHKQRVEAGSAFG